MALPRIFAGTGAALRRLTTTHLNQPLAIVVDGTIISTPVIIEPFGADFVITGIFSKAAAEKLADAIRNPDHREPNPQSKLDGVWIAEQVTTAGEVVPKEKFPFEIHFENDKMIFRFVPPSSGKDRVHEIVVDETKAPATIDITWEIRGKKETVYGIYKFEGDRLVIYSLRDKNGQPAATRPTDFGAGDEAGSDLLVLTRKPDPQQ